MKKVRKITLPSAEEPANNNQEWLPESEGQLTIDVYQTTNDIVIKSTIAGVSPEDLDITITNDMVTIKGKRQKNPALFIQKVIYCVSYERFYQPGGYCNAPNEHYLFRRKVKGLFEIIE